MQRTPWNKALNLLARRERSRQELAQRISQSFPELDPEELESVLVRLQDTGLQSDERFTESWVRARYQQGKGPIRIRYELREKGVAEHLAERFIESEEFDWYRCAEQQVGKKAPAGELDFPAKAKLHRFLSYRGFTSDQIEYAIEAHQRQQNLA